jgi:hypothetical protein
MVLSLQDSHDFWHCKTKGHSPPTAISHLHLFQLASPFSPIVSGDYVNQFPVFTLHTTQWEPVMTQFLDEPQLSKLSYKPSYFHLTLMVHSHLMLSQC